MTGLQLSAIVLLGAAAVSAQQPAVIPVDGNLVRILATAKNQAGELVGTLRKEDLEVYDNGVRQEIGNAVCGCQRIDCRGSLKYET